MEDQKSCASLLACKQDFLFQNEKLKESSKPAESQGYTEGYKEQNVILSKMRQTHTENA